MKPFVDFRHSKLNFIRHYFTITCKIEAIEANEFSCLSPQPAIKQSFFSSGSVNASGRQTGYIRLFYLVFVFLENQTWKSVESLSWPLHSKTIESSKLIKIITFDRNQCMTCYLIFNSDRLIFRIFRK